MKRYKLLKGWPGIPEGTVLDLDEGSTFTFQPEKNHISMSIEGWMIKQFSDFFEELPESQEKNNTYCSEHKVFNCRHPQPQEKEECEYEDDELYIDPDKLFPPQPKQKPSEIIMEREFLLRYEKRKSKPWYISEDSIRSNARWEALLDFLDEYLK